MLERSMSIDPTSVKLVFSSANEKNSYESLKSLEYAKIAR